MGLCMTAMIAELFGSGVVSGIADGDSKADLVR